MEKKIKAWAVLTSDKKGIARTKKVVDNFFPAIYRNKMEAEYQSKHSTGEVNVVPCYIIYKLKK